MSDPTTTNSTATMADNIISATASTLEKVTEDMIIADVPLLATPIIKQLWEGLFNWIMGYASRAAQTGATFAVIDTQVNSEQSGMSSALAALVAAEKSGDANAIQKAIQAYQAAQSSLINSNGSATPS